MSKYSMIPPDIGICDYCLEEVLDPRSRWYRYPFNSCAWCGPRFTMIKRVPYDRENTAMADFPMCEKCLSEYRDPRNSRRFHAQGISCPACGPRVFLLDGEGREINVGDPIAEAAKLVDEGFVVAVKGLGGFHLAALATDDEVVAELRRRKSRPQKPFALMALNLEVVERISSPTLEHESLLRSPQRPIVLVPKREDSPVSELVAPGLATLGIMLPYTGLHYLLLSETRDKFLIMTSGNRRGLPICRDESEALRELRGIADYFLVHNRKIYNRADDSVVRISAGEPVFLRRSRGYAPRWIKLPFALERPVVAVGALLDNAGAIAFDRYVVPTQYVGDVENYQTLEYLEEALSFLIRAYRLELGEAVFACDMHPEYLTTRVAEEWAERVGGDLARVQHHHAHVASAMASLGFDRGEGAVGIAVDGVGYGIDGNIWGGEVLYVEYDRFERIGRLEYCPLPGGDRATRYPARIALGILASKLGCEEAEREARRLGLLEGLPHGELELRATLAQLARCPLACSAGRFLDAVSALLGVCRERTYEGEPAIKLEDFSLGGSLVEELRLEVEERRGELVVLTRDLFVRLVELLGRERRRDLAFSIQYLLGRALGEIALEGLRDYGVGRIVVSGGAAVNELLVKGIESVVKDGARVARPASVPPGDGGLAVGQALIAYFSTK